MCYHNKLQNNIFLDVIGIFVVTDNLFELFTDKSLLEKLPVPPTFLRKNFLPELSLFRDVVFISTLFIGYFVVLIFCLNTFPVPKISDFLFTYIFFC